MSKGRSESNEPAKSVEEQMREAQAEAERQVQVKLRRHKLRSYFLDDYQELFGQSNRRTFQNPYGRRKPHLYFCEPRRQRFQTPKATFNQQLSGSADQKTQLCQPCRSQLESAVHTSTRAKLIYYLNRFSCPNEFVRNEADLRVCQICRSHVESSSDVSRPPVGQQPAGQQPPNQADDGYKRPWLRIAEQIVETSRNSLDEKLLNSIQATTKLLESTPISVKHPIGGQLVRLVVAVNTSLDVTLPDYDRLLPVKQQPNRANNQDVVLTNRQLVSLNSRWRPAEPIDHDLIRYWNAGPFDLDILNLRRIKLYGLPRGPLHDLLHFLAELTEVVELEIDTLQQLQGRRVVYNFFSLELLSIDLVRIVGDDGRGIEPATTDEKGNEIEQEPIEKSIVIRAPKLNVIYLGSDSIDHLLLPDSKPLMLTTDLIPVDLADPLLQKLRILVVNHIPTVEEFESIACDKVLPKLLCVHFNLAPLDSTSYEPGEEAGHLVSLYDVFERLVANAKEYEKTENANKPHAPVIRSDLNFYVQGVKLEWDKDYHFYKFDQALIRHRFTSELKQGLDVAPCNFVSSVEYADLFNTFLDPAEGGTPELLRRFHQLYPCIRRVEFTAVAQDWQLNGFLSFLDSCSCLTELKISQPVLIDDQFCRRLTELRSCRTLRLLELVANRFACGQQPLQLNFLSTFSDLCKFHSNLVTGLTLYELEAQMQLGCLYEFHFKNEGSDLSRCTIRIRKISKADGGECEFELGVEEEFDIPTLSVREDGIENPNGTCLNYHKHCESFALFRTLIDYCRKNRHTKDVLKSCLASC